MVARVYWSRGRLRLICLAALALVAFAAFRAPRGALRKVDPKDAPPFYLVELEGLPARFPKLRNCAFTVYGGASYVFFENHPARVADPSRADVAVFPGYLSYETNWPFNTGWRGNGVAGKEEKICRSEAIEAALGSLRGMTGRNGKQLRVLMLDSAPWEDLDDAVYNGKHPLIYAHINMKTTRYKPQSSISLPPPFQERWTRFERMPQFHSLRRARTRKEGDRNAFRDPLYTYFASFKGNTKAYPLRKRMLELHNETQGVIIVDSWDPSYNFDNLLSSSAFVLAPRGDAEFSYRFTEAVCSGGVPVLLADGYVTPFEQMIDFRTYGIQVAEADLDRLVEILTERYLRGDHLVLRKNALRFCYGHLVSIYHQFETTLRIAGSIVRGETEVRNIVYPPPEPGKEGEGDEDVADADPKVEVDVGPEKPDEDAVSGRQKVVTGWKRPTRMMEG
ncbi:exostosin family-domain-containing protein [Hyaloraphidium curvatum]|nr:exostosin family-domain-containing protein [Hyaloraphidium curvatum]